MTGVDVTVREAIRFVACTELVEDGMHLSSDLALDSLNRVECRQAIEESLGIEIDDAEFDGVKTVGDAIRLAESKVGELRT
ncbi:MAG: acyl carrier protein [Rhizobiaceae bacterium]|nr:acyl carrier protein [Rhizobiaceae bacterium]